jgi:hypothetical protein
MLRRAKKNEHINSKKILILLNKKCLRWDMGSKGWLGVVICKELGNDSFTIWITR